VSLSSGNVDLLNRVRTFKKIYPEMAQLVTDQAPLERLAVMHTNARDRAEHLLELVQHIAPPDQTVITEATTAIGTQIGPGAIGIALIRARS
jgi:fatty acid-binding protein DegV